MRLTTALLIRNQEASSKNRSINAAARDDFEDSAAKCEGNAIELGHWAGTRTNAADAEKGVNTAVQNVMMAVSGALLIAFPPAGLVASAITAGFIAYNAVEDADRRDDIEDIRLAEGQQKLCGTNDKNFAKKFDDRVKSESEDMKQHIQRILEHSRRDYENAHGEK